MTGRLMDPSSPHLSHLAAVVAVASILLAPTALAGHWLAYYELGDSFVGRTLEDDGETFHAPGHPWDGTANRVVHDGSVPGDGSLFLDAITGQQIGLAGAGTVVYAGLVGEGLLARSNLLLSGAQDTSAWYGEWTDLDRDGVIDDVHDGANAPEDEFLWRGAATGENVAVNLFQFPSSPSLVPGVLGAARGSDVTTRALEDRTALTQPEQGWTGAQVLSVDGGVLVTVYALVVAGAPAAPGATPPFDLTAQGVLHDVDRYESLNPDAEALWRSSAPLASQTIDDAILAYQQALRTIGEKREEILELIDHPPPVSVNEVRDAALGYVGNWQSLTMPAGTREPNTEEDDYGSRAVFGGVGDRWGSGNTYPGYASGWHLYVDNLARAMAPCAGAFVAVPGSSVTASRRVCSNPVEYDPGGALLAQERSAGFALGFRAIVAFWNDANGDGHLGSVCDPGDPEDFDAERNACTNAPWAWPHAAFGERHAIACDVSDYRSAVARVRPVAGDWGGAMLIRDYPEPTRVAYEVHWEVLEGSTPVELRWRDDCYGGVGTQWWIHSRDAIVFPTGMSVGLRVETAIGVDAFNDASLGLDVAAERVVDVDYLAPSL